MFLIKNIYFLIFFVIINFARSNSDMKKSWVKTSGNNLLTPNLEPDYPQFTPFDQSHVISKTVDNIADIDDDDDGNEENNEVSNNPSNSEIKLVPQIKEESLVDKLLPLTDYIYEIYKAFHNTNKNEKIATDGPEEKIDIDGKLDLDDIQGEIEEITEPTTEEYPTKHSKRKRKKYLKYNVGPGVNVSLDVTNEIVKVHLDEKCLKDVFTGKLLLKKKLFQFYLNFN